MPPFAKYKKSGNNRRAVFATVVSVLKVTSLVGFIKNGKESEIIIKVAHKMVHTYLANLKGCSSSFSSSLLLSIQLYF